jgi:sulfate adenylyltransferase
MPELLELTALSDKLREAAELPSVRLTSRQLCDYEMLASGAFAPLDRFMSAEDHACVLEEMRLANGSLFPIPITLPLHANQPGCVEGEVVALRDSRNEVLATMRIEETYSWDKTEVAQAVFGTTDVRHPLVAELESWGRLNVSGELTVLKLPKHYDFQDLRLTPRETKRVFEGDDSNRPNHVVAFQTRNPLHRAHELMAERAATRESGTLFLHPVVGMTRPDDIDHYTRVRTYRRFLEVNRACPSFLALCPLAMRFAGPREALWHAIIRRNYGATHIVIGRDHGGVGDFYEPTAAHALVAEHSAEIGIEPVSFDEIVYVPQRDRSGFYEELKAVPANTPFRRLSGTAAREALEADLKTQPGDDWLMRPEILDILREAYPPRHQQGVCIWFTGLSAAGKSTIADALAAQVLESGRQVTVLDGDVVRTHLSAKLSFTKRDRDENVRRIGYVASEIVRHGGVVICAAISPYRAARNEARSLMPAGTFIEVFVDTPLDVCEQRDMKGLYARARDGDISNLTGIDDPYERPENPEITLQTVDIPPEANASRIIERLVTEGFVQVENRKPKRADINS